MTVIESKATDSIEHERSILVDTIREAAINNGLIDDREPEYKRDLCNLYYLVSATIDLKRQIQEAYPHLENLQSMSRCLLGIEGILGHLIEEVISPVDMMILPDVFFDGIPNRKVPRLAGFNEVQKYYSKKKVTNYEELRKSLEFLLF